MISKTIGYNGVHNIFRQTHIQTPTICTWHAIVQLIGASSDSAMGSNMEWLVQSESIKSSTNSTGKYIPPVTRKTREKTDTERMMYFYNFI